MIYPNTQLFIDGQQQAVVQVEANVASQQVIPPKPRALASADQDSNANRNTGPSASYAAKVRARILPNIIYPASSNISGNPNAAVQVTVSPDGTILDRRLLKSSGVPSWDAAVMRAINQTQTLPLDVDGRVPSSIIIEFRPH